MPDFTCEILGQTECLSQGGLWQSDGSDCTTGNCPCPPDINGSGEVNVIDLIRLLLCFGLPAAPECVAEDVNGDGTVNVLDLIDLLLCFGLPASPGCEAEDINEDGTVNVLDLIDLLLEFGQACP